MLSLRDFPSRVTVLFVVLIIVHGVSRFIRFRGPSNDDDDDGAIVQPEMLLVDLSAPGPARVDLKVYIESLCIDTKRFLEQQLVPAYQALGSEVVDLQVVVFGNSKIDLNAETVSCQHGPVECDTNVYELCATSIYPHPPTYLPFFACLFNDLPMGYREENFDTSLFADCAGASGLDFFSIKACHDNPVEAWTLQKNAATMTPPKHSYVPWVDINGQHSIDEEKDCLLDKLCDAYGSAGGSHPACQQYVIKERTLYSDFPM